MGYLLVLGMFMVGFMVPECFLLIGGSEKARVPVAANIVSAFGAGFIGAYIAFG